MVANLSLDESTFSGGSYFSKEGSIFIGREVIWDDGVAFSKPPSFHSVIVFNMIRMQELDYVIKKLWYLPPAVLTSIFPRQIELCWRFTSLFKKVRARWK